MAKEQGENNRSQYLRLLSGVLQMKYLNPISIPFERHYHLLRPFCGLPVTLEGLLRFKLCNQVKGVNQERKLMIGNLPSTGACRVYGNKQFACSF